MGEGQGQPLAGRVHLAGDRLYVAYMDPGRLVEYEILED